MQKCFKFSIPNNITLKTQRTYKKCGKIFVSSMLMKELLSFISKDSYKPINITSNPIEKQQTIEKTTGTQEKMFSLIQKDRNSGQRSENTFSLYETGKEK